jgi:hypothetical protein
VVGLRESYLARTTAAKRWLDRCFSGLAGKFFLMAGSFSLVGEGAGGLFYVIHSRSFSKTRRQTVDLGR